MPNGVPQRRFNDTKHICTCIDQTPIRNSRIHPFIDSKSWISGYNLIIIDPKHSREKKIQATYGLRFYDPLFCNILAFSLFDSKFYFLLLSTQFFTFHEAKYYIQTPSILSYITAIYFFPIFFSLQKQLQSQARQGLVRSQRINNVPVITPTTSEAFFPSPSHAFF